MLFKAYLRAVTNTAIGLGSVFGGAALVVDETWAYVVGLRPQRRLHRLRRLEQPRGSPTCRAYRRAEGEPRLAVLRDWPYAVIVAVTGLFSLHFFVMELGLALFISERTEAPPVMVAVLLLLNTACVALFQVRLSRRADSVEAGARALVRGAVWIAAGFAIVSLADRGDATFAIVVLVAGSLVHVVGEMIGSGGQWGLQMGLAPHERQGQYQGFAGLGFSVVAVVGPPIVTLLCVDMGETGWLILAGMMLAIAPVSVPVSRWALASRERYGVLHPLRLRHGQTRMAAGIPSLKISGSAGNDSLAPRSCRAAVHAAAQASSRSSSAKPDPRNQAGAVSPLAASASRRLRTPSSSFLRASTGDPAIRAKLSSGCTSITSVPCPDAGPRHRPRGS